MSSENEDVDRAERLRKKRRDLFEDRNSETDETTTDRGSEQVDEGGSSGEDVEVQGDDNNADDEPEGQPDGDTPDTRQYVEFKINDQSLALDIQNVREILSYETITPVFHTPDFVLGVTNLRGDILAVLDIGRFIGLEPSEVSSGKRIVVAEHEGNRAGFLADSMIGVEPESEDRIQTPPPTVEGISGEWVQGVRSDETNPLLILDAGSIFTSERIQEL